MSRIPAGSVSPNRRPISGSLARLKSILWIREVLPARSFPRTRKLWPLTLQNRSIGSRRNGWLRSRLWIVLVFDGSRRIVSTGEASRDWTALRSSRTSLKYLGSINNCSLSRAANLGLLTIAPAKRPEVYRECRTVSNACFRMISPRAPRSIPVMVSAGMIPPWVAWNLHPGSHLQRDRHLLPGKVELFLYCPFCRREYRRSSAAATTLRVLEIQSARAHRLLAPLLLDVSTVIFPEEAVMSSVRWASCLTLLLSFVV